MQTQTDCQKINKKKIKPKQCNYRRTNKHTEKFYETENLCADFTIVNNAIEI